MYPLLFKPNLHSIVWGGHQLKGWKGMPKDNEPIGESWEISAVPTSPSVIANGEYAGQKLTDLVEKYPNEILGKKNAEHYNNKMPLLVKFIDAERDLSIQVHPNDKMAQREHGKLGKTEMWYVLDAKPGAYLYAGFKKQLTADEYKTMVEDGTICDALAKHEVKKGDVFFLPAGRVHAICGGILLAEVQQSSDVTYRIYDYKRLGMDGKPRELHTELAAKALDYNVYPEYRTLYTEEDNKANVCIDSPFFTVSVINTECPMRRALKDKDSFVIVMCLKGDCRITINGTTEGIELKEGYSCLIPAEIADYNVAPVNGKTQVLEAYV